MTRPGKQTAAITRRQNSAIVFRCTLAESERIRRAAKKSHLPLSSWVRAILLREADMALAKEES